MRLFTDADELVRIQKENDWRDSIGLPPVEADSHKPLTSCVIELDAVQAGGEPSEPTARKPSNAERMFAALAGSGSAMSKGQLLAASGVKPGSFAKALKELGDRVICEAGQFRCS
jgi:hypothetical protein